MRKWLQISNKLNKTNILYRNLLKRNSISINNSYFMRSDIVINTFAKHRFLIKLINL